MKKALLVAVTACAILHTATTRAAPNVEVLAAAKTCDPKARTLLQQLVQIDSGTSDAAGVDAIGAVLRIELEHLGAKVESVPATAPGAGDDKAGIVSAVCALGVLHEINYRDYARITLLLNSNEETGSVGTRDLIRAKAKESDVVINLERGSHQALQLGFLADSAKETTVNVTMIQGGNAINVIPDHAVIKADVRALTLPEFDRVETGLAKLAGETIVPEVQVKASMTRNFPPWPPSASTEALLTRAQKLYAEIGRQLAGVPVGSSADVAFAAETGTPAIDGVAILGGGAHGVEDYADLSSITPRVYLLTRMLMDLGHNPAVR
jgi:glutamate carboxypeptidase